MSGLVFRVCLLAALCWQSGVAERSANGYFYDKPEGTLFEEGPAEPISSAIFPPQEVSSSLQLQAQQLPSSLQLQPPQQVQSTLHLQPPPVPQVHQSLDAGLEIVPAQLVFENTQVVNQGIGGSYESGGYQNGGFSNGGFDSGTFQSGSVSSAQVSQPVAFSLQDDTQAYNSIQQPCGPEPIVAQFNPAFVDLAAGGPLTRQITTCGPNNNCQTITVQADKNRHLGVLQAQGRANYYSNVQQSYQPEPRTAGLRGLYADAIVRPPNRRLIEYTEEVQDDAYN